MANRHSFFFFFQKDNALSLGPSLEKKARASVSKVALVHFYKAKPSVT